MFRPDSTTESGAAVQQLRSTATFIKVRHAGEKVTFRVTSSYMFRDLKEDICDHW